jgi:hypothetical protein
VAGHQVRNYRVLLLTEAWLENAAAVHPLAPATQADQAVPQAHQAVVVYALASGTACHEMNPQNYAGACQIQAPHMKMEPQKARPHAGKAVVMHAAACLLPQRTGQPFSPADATPLP